MFDVAVKGAFPVLLTLLAFSSAGAGQDPPRTDSNRGDSSPRRPGLLPEARSYAASGSLLDIVQVASVASALDVSPGQLAKIRESTGGSSRGIAELNRAIIYARDHGQVDQFNAASASLSQLRSSDDAAVRKVLKPKQMNRLLQIVLQQEGIRAILRQEVREAIGMSDEQLESLQLAVQAREAERDETRSVREQSLPQSHVARNAEINRKIVVAGSTDAIGAEDKKFLAQQVELRRRYEAADKKADRRLEQGLVQLLTKSQKARFLKLYGKPFDLDTLTREHLVEAELRGAAAKVGNPPPNPR